MAQLLAMAEALKQQNETFKDFIQFLQTQLPKEDGFARESLYLQLLSKAVWADKTL